MQVTKKVAPIERSNPLTVSFRADDTQAVVEQYKSELSPKPYFERARTEFITASFLSYLANLVSVLTAFSFLLFNLVSILPDFIPDVVLYGIGGFISIVLLVSLEATKRTNTSNYFKSRIVGKDAAMKNAVVLVLLSVVSIGFSGMGAAYLAELATDESKQLTEQRDDELKTTTATMTEAVQTIEAEIQAMEEGVQKAISKRQLLTMPAATAQTIQGKRDEIKAIRAEAETIRGTITTNYDGLLNTNDDSTRSALYFMLGVSLVAELLAILCIWYAMYYKYRVILEAGTTTRSALLDVTTTERPTEQTEQTNKDSCMQCSQQYAKRATHQKFCSKECRLTYHEEKKGIDLSRFRMSCFLPLMFIPAKVVFGLFLLGLFVWAVWRIVQKAQVLMDDFKKENKRIEKRVKQAKREAKKYEL